MSFNKLVSVIIPAYNHEKFIGSCIESIAAQTYEELELIIVNDGSTDNTHNKIIPLIEQYKARFKDIVYINRDHKGTAATLNELISLSSGSFIFQIASDDMAKPAAIKTLFDFMLRNSRYALAVGDNEIIDSSNKRVYWDMQRNLVDDISLAAYKTFGDYLQKTRNMDFNSKNFGKLTTLLRVNHVPNGKMFRKSALLEVGCYEEGVLEDWYINLKLARKYKFKYFDKILFSYRWHDNNTIKNRTYMKQVSNNMKGFLDAEKKRLNLPTKAPKKQKVFARFLSSIRNWVGKK